MSNLFIDIDSTIWPAEREYERACKRIYGCSFGNDWYSEEVLEERFGPDYQRIFDEALAPEKVMSRRLYPGVTEGINKLYRMGYNIIFITHNRHVEEMYEPLNKWLTLCFPMVHARLIVAHPSISKAYDIMQDYDDVWGIIEDNEINLIEASSLGYNTLAKAHPWNLTTCDVYDIIRFDRWDKVPQLVTVGEGINVVSG